jgi:small subunit ribosomal protein S4
MIKHRFLKSGNEILNMARYNGPKTKISRIFGEPILGNGKWLGKNSNPPGQHGAARKRKSLGEYALQLREKQKAKYTYGVLEKQFRKTFEEAARRKGVTGENLIKLLEARLDNTVFRMGIAPSRPAARQLVSHKHVTVNGEIVNIPSFQLQPGDIVSLKDKSKDNTAVTSQIRGKNQKFNWVDWNETEMQGTFITYPERESVPENIKEQLIVELYSK